VLLANTRPEPHQQFSFPTHALSTPHFTASAELFFCTSPP
jgi:hypothetical protein